MGNIVADVADARHVQGDALDRAKHAVFENLEIVLREAADDFVLLIERIPVHAEVRPVEHDDGHYHLERFHPDG